MMSMPISLNGWHDIQNDQLLLESCITRVKQLEERTGFTAKATRATALTPEEAQQRLALLEDRVKTLRGKT